MSAIDKLSEKFLWCRDVRHSWDPYNVKRSRNKVTRRSEMYQILICDRCGTLKTRVLTPDGDFIRSGGYDYPDGYQLKGQGQMSPADRAYIRKINMKASLKQQKDESE